MTIQKASNQHSPFSSSGIDSPDLDPKREVSGGRWRPSKGEAPWHVQTHRGATTSPAGSGHGGEDIAGESQQECLYVDLQLSRHQIWASVY
jgi:hypothetical protein